MRTLIHTDHFETLKKRVLESANHDHITASDCKKLALVIEQRLKERVSETTMKRIFGFAEARCNPSAFTMDLLAKFCGYTHWEDFLTNAYTPSEVEPHVTPCVQDLRKHIHQITTYTLQTLQDRSGIPFQYTVSRNFLDEHFDYFCRSYYTGTIFFAPTGYGKTVGLCHLVSNLLNKWQDHRSEADLVFFISFNALSNAYLSGRDIHGWLLCLLGYNRDDEFTQLMAELKKKDLKFYFIIDGLDNTIIKGAEFRLILSQIADIFARYRGHASFKMVLSMRTTTLRMYEDVLLGTNQEWFMGFENNIEHANVPLLDMAELKTVADAINPIVKQEVTIDEVGHLQYPLYLQYHYRSSPNNFNLKNINQTSIFDYVMQFVQGKVFKGNTFKKHGILNAICENLNYGPQKCYAVKANVERLIEQHKTSYKELLSVGYIVETKSHFNMKNEVQIGFSDEYFTSYAIAAWLLEKTNNLLSKQLIQKVDASVSTSLRLKIIKWFIIYGVQTEQLITADIFNAKLCIEERASLIQFLRDLLKKNNSKLDEKFGNDLQHLVEGHKTDGNITIA